MTLTQNHKSIFFLLLSVGLLAISFGIDVVAFPATLAAHNITPIQVGIASVFELSAGIIISFFLSRIVAKMGMMKSLFFFATFYAAAVAAIFYFVSFYLWLFLIFTIGTCWFAFFTIRQSWLNMIVENKNRSVVLALFSTVLCGGITVGPILVKIFGIETHRIFAISASFIFLAFLALLPLYKVQPDQIESERISLKKFFKENPRCFLTRIFFEIQCDCILVFGVIFGVKIGFKSEDAGLLTSAFMLSGLFDILLGFLIKKNNPYKLINLGFFSALLCGIGIILFQQSYLLLVIIYFFLGSSLALTYIASSTIINSQYGSKQLLAANSTFQSIGVIGMLLGSIIGGIFMEVFSLYGFALTIIFSNLAYLIFIFFYGQKQN
ncbi:MAG: MFS transporter [Rickettsiales bacterium]|nr:MFS transporter [Rickettsiales bacterium]